MHQKVTSICAFRRSDGLFYALAAAVIGMFSLLFDSPKVWAASAEASHSITVVVVSPQMSLKSDSGSSSLTFSDTKPGSDTTPQRAEYQIALNTVTSLQYEGIVSAQMENADASNVVLEADVEDFTQKGMKGNAHLYESSEGFQSVGGDPTPLASKGNSSSAQDSIVNGTLPVRWKAKAVHPLRKKSYTVFVTVTMKDT